MIGGGVWTVMALWAAATAQSPDFRMPPPDVTEARALGRLKEAQRLMGEDEFPAAARAFQESIDLDPLLFMAHYGLGRARMATKEYAAAAAAFERARETFQAREEENAHRRARQAAAREDRMRLLQQAVRSGRTNFDVRGVQAELAMLEAAKAVSQGANDVPAPLSLPWAARISAWGAWPTPSASIARPSPCSRSSPKPGSTWPWSCS